MKTKRRERLKAHVTWLDIRLGRRRDDCRCPVAIACSTLGLTGILVGDKEINTDQGDFAVSPRTTKRIRDYDDGDAMEPFVLHLYPVDEFGQRI